LQQDNQIILVDTGLDRAYAEKANPHIIKNLNDTRGELKIDIDPPDALRELGIDPNDVTHVIITHCHLDHISCVPRFPNATFITSRFGLEWMSNPPFQGIVDPIVVPIDIVQFLWCEAKRPNGRVILTEDNASPMPGIRTVRVGGHSIDSQIVFIETEKGTVGLGADNIITYKHITDHIAPGSPVNLLDSLAAMQLLQEQADLIIPGHDPGLFDLYPNGVIV
jgi:glyoxylase-like metal-dependent hydrolase (beta-lactamase superfamily II)